MPRPKKPRPLGPDGLPIKPTIKPRRKGPKREQPEPIGPEEALRVPTSATVWEHVRASYPLEARLAGDLAARGISLSDLLALELATHATYGRQARDVDPAGKERVTLMQSQAQSRRAARALLVHLEPARKALDRIATDHETPEWMTVGTDAWVDFTARYELHEELGGDDILD